jgi:hypothetical protein
MKIIKKSAFTGRMNEMDLDVTPQALQRWHDGELIQNVFPHLSRDEREFLMTGVTGDEWRDAFGSHEEE